MVMDVDMMDAPSAATPSFHLFTNLPPELRVKIWNMARPGTRIVPISCGSESLSFRDKPLTTRKTRSSPSSPIMAPITTSCTSTAPIPSTLHVCSESRVETEKHYRPYFGLARDPGRIFFNPATDVLFFGPRQGFMAADSQFHSCMSMCDPEELASVRRIAISDALFWIDNQYRSMTASSLSIQVIRQIARHLPGLQEIIFTPREEDVLNADMAYVRHRMYMQASAAISAVMEEYPQWTSPPCRIMTLEQLAQIDSIDG